MRKRFSSCPSNPKRELLDCVYKCSSTCHTNRQRWMSALASCRKHVSLCAYCPHDQPDFLLFQSQAHEAPWLRQVVRAAEVFIQRTGTQSHSLCTLAYSLIPSRTPQVADMPDSKQAAHEHREAKSQRLLQNIRPRPGRCFRNPEEVYATTCREDSTSQHTFIVKSVL